ncbi:hypothetical protein PVA19_14505 [Agrobacterium sp. CNPSo 3708]|uniref:hypothetical protein n=1 Tax=unclassified Agrobacterium TaxID=2632611 RepID=UPI0023636CE2|nr:hypothetical protein [Agrobacterium sp. CNPSo 3708]MDD1499632.1 hypothetical protein [Agrobacterium sp. CNPSo 3708]
MMQTVFNALNGENHEEEWTPEPSSESLADLKARLKASIDDTAEAERRKYITQGAGQAMTYMRKADEASRYIAATNPDASGYPLLSAEVGITAPTMQEVAQVVHAAYSQWQIISAAIEAARLATKAAIESSETIEEAQAAANALSWPSPGQKFPQHS